MEKHSCHQPEGHGGAIAWREGEIDFERFSTPLDLAWKRAGERRARNRLPEIHRYPKGAGTVYMCSHCRREVFKHYLRVTQTSRPFLDNFFGTLTGHNCEKGMQAKDLRVIRFKSK